MGCYKYLISLIRLESNHKNIFNELKFELYFIAFKIKFNIFNINFVYFQNKFPMLSKWIFNTFEIIFNTFKIFLRVCFYWEASPFTWHLWLKQWDSISLLVVLKLDTITNFRCVCFIISSKILQLKVHCVKSFRTKRIKICISDL